MRYVDASILVSVVTPEDTSDRAVAWLQSTVLGTLHVSEWVTAEVAAALAASHELELSTTDKRLAVGAKQLGYAVELITS